MSIEDLKLLLEKFYQGLTTNDEEFLLAEYFRKHEVTSDLFVDKQLFLQLYHDEEIVVPANLSKKLETFIDKQSKVNRPQTLNKQRRVIFIRTLSIAASIALILVSLHIFQTIKTAQKDIILVQKEELRDTYTDPEQAYAEAEKAILMVASNLNKAVLQLDQLPTNIEKSNKILNTSLNKIKE